MTIARPLSPLRRTPGRLFRLCTEDQKRWIRKLLDSGVTAEDLSEDDQLIYALLIGDPRLN